MKIVSVVGARPQFIKAAPVFRAINNHNLSPKNSQAQITEVVVHTGQHYHDDMSAVFFRELHLPKPDYHLRVGSGPHGEQTGEILKKVEKVLIEESPDCVLVYGDTNSTLAAALAAAKLNIPIAHVEAGLRSFKKSMPEEINRVLTDHVSTYLFSPSQRSINNLERENIKKGVFNVGDVMHDAVLFYKDRLPEIRHSGPFALATIHRAENTDNKERMMNILSALARSPIKILLPLHPRTRKCLEQYKYKQEGALELIDPLSYLDMLAYLSASKFVMTDSGGLQKEAYYLKRKCITLRDETEWLELVDVGVNAIAGADQSQICSHYNWALEPLSEVEPIFGEGDSAEKIVSVLSEAFH